VLFLTLTLPHEFGQPLNELLKVVRAAFSSLLSGRAWVEDKSRFELEHYIRAHDITHGPNGWHPHIHMILLGRRVLDATELSELEDRLYYRWMSAVCGEGHPPPSRMHGILLEKVGKQGDLARYVSQVASASEKVSLAVGPELARGDLKTSTKPGHRTPWQILSDIASTGDPRDIRLWHEYEKATQGVHAIRWSRGLRKVVELAAEKTGEEIVAEEIGGEKVYQFKAHEWFSLCRTPGAQAEVLRVVEEEGPASVGPFITSLPRYRPDRWARRRWAFSRRNAQE